MNIGLCSVRSSYRERRWGDPPDRYTGIIRHLGNSGVVSKKTLSSDGLTGVRFRGSDQIEEKKNDEDNPSIKTETETSRAEPNNISTIEPHPSHHHPT